MPHYRRRDQPREMLGVICLRAQRLLLLLPGFPSGLFLKLAQPLTEPRLLPVYRSDFFQQSSMRIVETLHDRG